MAEGGLSSVEDGWESFLDWCTEHGIAVRGATDWMEQRGIPSLPAFALLLLILALAIWFVAVPLILGPQTGEVKIALTDTDGKPIVGAQVQVSSVAATPAFSTLSGFTDANGAVKFSQIPAGTVQVSASYPGYSDTQQQVDVLAGMSTPVTLQSASQQQKSISLQLSINGPSDSSKTTTELQDAYFNTIATLSGFSPSFTVQQNSTYNLRITSPGFKEEDLLSQQTGTSDAFLGQIDLKPLAAAQAAKVHAMVLDRNGTAIANASVEIISPLTQAVLATLSTGEDGASQPTQLAAGTQFQVRASKEGYVTGISPTQPASDGLVVQVGLVSIQDAQKAFVEVVDQGGKDIENPVVKLYRATAGGQPVQIAAQQPADGKASFALDNSSSYSLTAWASGFLPKFVSRLSPGSVLVQLTAATSDNSASLKVHATNFDGSDGQAASISVWNADGTPLGLPELTTGVDGIQLFDSLPLGLVEVNAESNGRRGSAQVSLSAGSNNLSVQLLRAGSQVSASVTDLFTNAPIQGAVVTIHGLNQSACTTSADGQCSVSLSEYAGASASVSAPGYESFSSSSFNILPNSPYPLPVQLFSSSVRATTQLQFLGAYDANGDKVSELSPASDYQARFLALAPPANFSAANAFIYLGQRQDALDRDPAAIESYDAGGAQVFAGTGFELASSLPPATVANASLAIPSNAPQAASPGAQQYKWAQFVFPAFSGSREISLNFRTKAVASGSVELHYDTAYDIGGQVIRSPTDADAGVTKSDLLANDVSQTLKIGFEGTCDGQTCVQLNFDNSGQKSSLDGFEVPVGTQFQLDFSAFSGNGTLSAELDSNSISLGVLSGQSGAGQALSTTDPSTGFQSVTVPVGGGQGTFSLLAQRASNDAQLQFSLKNNGATVFQRTLFVRIVSFGPQVLRVSAKPGSLLALKSTPVVFTVKDELGLPVRGAHVTIGSVGDAVGREIDAVEGENGTYTAEQVQPSGSGVADYSVQADGFSTYKSSLRVDANQILQLNENSLSLNLTSFTDTANSQFSANNLLSNEVDATLFLTKDSAPQILQLAVQPQTVRVASQAELNAALVASVNQFVAALAQKQNLLNEKIIGTVEIVARAGSAGQTLSLPFSATAALDQVPIDQAWSADANAINFSLTPNSLTQSFDLHVSNNGPVPLLFNQQLNGVGVRISPLSLQVDPGNQGTFTLTATKHAPLGIGCVFSQSDTAGQLNLYASFQGLKSGQSLPIDVSLSPSSSCLPNSPQQLSLPLEMSVELPPDAKTRHNDDGSLAALFSSGEVVVFPQSAISSGVGIDVPSNEGLTLDSKFISSTADGNGKIVSFPFDATFSVPSGVQVIKRNQSSVVVLGDSQMALPGTLLFASTANQSQVKVPAGTQIEFSAMATLDTSNNPQAKTPAKLTLYFPPNTLFKSASDGTVLASLASGGTFGFDQQATLAGPDSNGRGTVSVPIGASFLPPSSVYGKLPGNGFSLQLPFAVDVEIASDSAVVHSQGSVVAFLPNYNLVLPDGTTFTPSAGGKTASLQAGASIKFYAFDGSELAGNNDYTLPVSLYLTIPGDARLDTTGTADTVELSTGSVLSLPSDTSVGATQADGSRVAVVGANEKVSFPPAFVANLPKGGYRLSFPSDFAIGVPSATHYINQQASTRIVLPNYDVTIPAGVQLSAKDGQLASDFMHPGQTVSITPPPSFSLDKAVRVVLPFDLQLTLPSDARIEKLSDSVGVLLSDGEVLGVQDSSVSTNSTTATAPANTPIALSPTMVLVADNSSTTLQLPLQQTYFFDSSATVARTSQYVKIAGSSFVVTLPASAILSQSQGSSQAQGATQFTAATVQPGSIVSVEASNFSVLGEAQTLPIPLSFNIPNGGFVHANADGSTYFEDGSARMLLSSGTTITANTVTVPPQTGIVFSPGLYTPVWVQGESPSTLNPANFKLTLPFPYSFPITQGTVINATPLGQTTYANGVYVIFPQESSVGTAPGINTTGQAVNAPGGSTTLFVGCNCVQSLIASGLNASGFFSTPEGRAAFFSKDNVVVIMPTSTTIFIPPGLNVTPAYGGSAVWLSSDQVLILGGAQPSQSQSFSGARVLSLQSTFPPGFTGSTGGGVVGQPPAQQVAGNSLTVAAGGQLSLPSSLASVAQDGAVSFQLPLQSSMDVPSDAQVFTQNNFEIIALNNPATDIELPSSISVSSTNGGNSADIPPGTRIIVQPSPFTNFAGGVSVSLPVEVDLSLPIGTRTSAQGGTTFVRFPDGSIGQFTGTVNSQGGLVPQQSSTTGGTSTLNVLAWQQGTNAQLDAKLAQGTSNGGFTLSFPVPVNVIVPQDARVSSGSSKTVIALSNGAGVTVNANAPISQTPSGQAVSLPAGTKFTVAPLGLDVQGPSITLPFDVSFTIPSDAISSQLSSGGLVVKFSGGQLAKFMSGSFGAGGLPGLNGFSSPTLPSSIGGQILNTYQAFPGFSSPNYASPTSSQSASYSSQSNSVMAPSLSPIITSPGLSGASSTNGYAGMGAAGSEYFSLPVPWIASVSSSMSPVQNPDGSISLFLNGAEVTFPAGAQATGGAGLGGFNSALTGTSSYGTPFGNGLGLGGFGAFTGGLGGPGYGQGGYGYQGLGGYGGYGLGGYGYGGYGAYSGAPGSYGYGGYGGAALSGYGGSISSMLVPAMAKVSIIPSSGQQFGNSPYGQGGSPYLGGPPFLGGAPNLGALSAMGPHVGSPPFGSNGYGGFGGQPVSLPFDLSLTMPQGTRYMPIGGDGSRTVVFPNGQTMQFVHDLKVNQQVFGQTGIAQGGEQVTIPLGTAFTGSAGILQSLGFASGSGSSSSGQSASERIKIPANQQGRIVGDPGTQQNSDGTVSVFFDNKEVRFPRSPVPDLSSSASGQRAEVHNGEFFDLLAKAKAASKLPGQTSAISLPLDIVFSVDAAKNVLQPKNSQGTLTVQFTDSEYIVFPATVAYDANAKTVTVPAGTQFNPSNNLLPPTQTRTSASSQATRFITPSNARLQLGGNSVVQEPQGLSITANNQQVRVPNRKYDSNSVLLNSHDAIEVSAANPTLSNLLPVKLPVTAYFFFLAETKVAKDSESGNVFATGADGSQMAFGPTSTISLPQANGGGQVVMVPSDESIFVPRGAANGIGANGLELRLPVNWGIATDSTSFLTKLPDGRNAIKIPGKTLNTIILPQSVQLNARFTYSAQGSRLLSFLPSTFPPGFGTGGVTSSAPGGAVATSGQAGALPVGTTVKIPPLAPVQLVALQGDLTGTCNGPTGDFETQLIYDPATSDSNDAAVIPVDYGDSASDLSGSVVINMARPHNVNVAYKSTNLPLLSLPNMAQLTATDARIDTNQQGGQIVVLHQGSIISMKVCNPADPLSHTVTQTYPLKFTYTLPGANIFKSTYQVEFPQCSAFDVTGSMRYSFSGVKRITFPSGADSTTFVAGGFLDKKATTHVVAVRDGVPVTLEYCSTPSGTATVTAVLKQLEFYTSSDGGKTFSSLDLPKFLSVVAQQPGPLLANIWVKNVGAQPVFVEALSPVENTAGNLAELVNVNNVVWETGGGPTNRPHSLQIPPGQYGNAFMQFDIPADSRFVDALGCMRGDVPPVEGNLNFGTGPDEKGTKQGAGKLKIQVKFQSNPATCRSTVIALGAARTGDFYATYAEKVATGTSAPQTTQQLLQNITFKGAGAMVDGKYVAGAGQKRYFALVNNRLEAVSVTGTPDAPSRAAAVCSYYDGGSTHPITDTIQLNPGDVQLVECISVAPVGEQALQQGYLSINATTASALQGTAGTTTTVSVKLVTYNPVGQEQTYTSSPWGEIASTGAPNALSQKFGAILSSYSPATAKVSGSGENSLQFDAAPGTPPASTSSTPSASSTASQNIQVNIAATSLCEEYYCSNAQILEGIRQLGFGGRALVENALDADSGNPYSKISQFIANRNGRSQVIRKSIIIQKAGAEPLDPALMIAQLYGQTTSAFNEWNLNAAPIDEIQTQLAGCGIYHATLELTLPSGGFSAASTNRDYEKQVGVKLTIQQLKSCADGGETLANAALLMGAPKADAPAPELELGRRVVWWPQELSWDRVGQRIDYLKSPDAGVLDKIIATSSLFSLGPYGEEADDQDLQSATQLYQAMFKAPLPQKNFIYEATSYSDNGYCFSHGKNQLGAAILAGTAGSVALAGTTAIAAALGIPTGGLSVGLAGASGVGTFILGKLTASLVQAGATCLLTGAGTGAVAAGSGSVTGCDAINACVQGAVASVFLPRPISTSGAGAASGVSVTGGGVASLNDLGSLALSNSGTLVKNGFKSFTQTLSKSLGAQVPTAGRGAFTAVALAGGGFVSGLLQADTGRNYANPTVPIAVIAGTKLPNAPGALAAAGVYKQGLLFQNTVSLSEFTQKMQDLNLIAPTKDGSNLALRIYYRFIQMTRGFAADGSAGAAPLLPNAPTLRESVLEVLANKDFVGLNNPAAAIPNTAFGSTLTGAGGLVAPTDTIANEISTSGAPVFSSYAAAAYGPEIQSLVTGSGKGLVARPADPILSKAYDEIASTYGNALAEYAGDAPIRAALTNTKNSLVARGIPPAEIDAFYVGGDTVPAMIAARDEALRLGNLKPISPLPSFKLSNVGSLAGSALFGYIQLLMMSAFHVDVKPVRAEFAQSNSIAVYHYSSDPKGVSRTVGNIATLGIRTLGADYWPTMRAVCEVKGGVCDDSTSKAVDGICSPTNGYVGCASMYKRKDGMGYVLIATFNDLTPQQLMQTQGVPRTGSTPASGAAFGETVQSAKFSAAASANPSGSTSSQPVTAPGQSDYNALSSQFFSSLFDPNAPPVSKVFGQTGAQLVH